jgi:cysteine desulfuration protein SufE
MNERLSAIVGLFQEADPEIRLQLLLDFADRLPELPEPLRVERDAGLNRVPECQSPVFLFLEHVGGGSRMWGDAPAEAPTVRGFVSLLREVVDGSETAEVARLPLDLLTRLGIAPLLGMMRTQGLSAILFRVRRSAESALETAGDH